MLSPAAGAAGLRSTGFCQHERRSQGPRRGELDDLHPRGAGHARGPGRELLRGVRKCLAAGAPLPPLQLPRYTPARPVSCGRSAAFHSKAGPGPRRATAAQSTGRGTTAIPRSAIHGPGASLRERGWLPGSLQRPPARRA